MQGKQLRKTPETQRKAAVVVREDPWGSEEMRKLQRRRDSLENEPSEFACDCGAFLAHLTVSDFVFSAGEAQVFGQLRYECDPQDVAHMTGLAMALDWQAAHKKLPEDLDRVTAVVQDHARALAAGKVDKDDVPLSVSTAVYTVVNSLWEQ